MTINNYGVLKATPIKAQLGSNKSPHYEILIRDDQGRNYRIAVNIKSQGHPSNLLYIVKEQIDSTETSKLVTLPSGFTAIHHNQPPIGLDYIRRHWFDPAKMSALPPEVSGANNDLNDKIQSYVSRAIKSKSTIYAFGDKWGPEKGKKDNYFGFLPGQGIHDIHMNQGNSGRWEKDNSTYQDGGLIIHLKDTDQWIGIFLAFQTQSWCTDDQGNPTKPVDECTHLTVDHMTS